MNESITTAVETCERFASDLFDGDEFFTQVTKWKDGDFRVMVWHGMGYEQDPYKKRAQQVTYKHDDGAVVFSEFTHRFDRHHDEYLKSEVLVEDLDV